MARKLNVYVTGNLLFVLVLVIFIATFVGMAGSIGKFLHIMNAGVKLQTVLLFVFYNLPKITCFTLPMGLLVATVLTFSRMSSDNELTALRASGVGLFQVITPVLLLGILLSALTWWLQFDIAPQFTPRARAITREEDPVALLETDAAMAMLPGYYLLIGGKSGNRITDVHIYEEDKKTHRLLRNITAREGTISLDRATRKVSIRLKNVMIVTLAQENPEGGSPSRAPIRLTAREWVQEMDYGNTSNRKPVVLSPGEMSLSELLAWVTITTAHGGKVGNYERADFIIELHSRAAWAISPFTLLLLAIPLGLQMSRRETSAGLVGSVVLAAGYYIPMTLFSDTIPPRSHPEYFIWGLNIGLQALGGFLIWRNR